MADALEADVQKKLHLKPKKTTDDEGKASSSSSSSSDEDVERVMAILTNEFGSDFKCTAGPSDCHYGDPLSQPSGIWYNIPHAYTARHTTRTHLLYCWFIAAILVIADKRVSESSAVACW